MNFLTVFEGKGLLPFSKQSLPWREISVNELREHVYAMALTAGLTWLESCRLSEKAKTSSEAEIVLMISGLEKRIKRENGLIFRRFRTYTVDKPFVDFIFVPEAFRRQGIGTALYRAGFQRMRSKGLPFYASSCQSELAKLAWQSLRNRFEVKWDRDQLPKLGKAQVKRLRLAA